MTTELTIALIGVVGTVLGAVVGVYLTYRLGLRGVSDREQFVRWQVAFNRSAFRGSYQMRSDPEPFLKAILDTLQAINTGMLVSRSNVEVTGQRGKGMTQLNDKGLRSGMFQVVGLLEQIKQQVQSQLNNQPVPDFISVIDNERDAVIRAMNQMWMKLGLQPLPLPTEVADYRQVYGE